MPLNWVFSHTLSELPHWVSAPSKDDDDELFCGMFDRRKAFNRIPSQGNCQRSSLSRVSDTPKAGLEPAQSLTSDFVE